MGYISFPYMGDVRLVPYRGRDLEVLLRDQTIRSFQRGAGEGQTIGLP